MTREPSEADAATGWRWWYGLAPKLLGAVALVIGIAEFNLMRPVHHPLAPKPHSEVEYQIGLQGEAMG